MSVEMMCCTMGTADKIRGSIGDRFLLLRHCDS